MSVPSDLRIGDRDYPLRLPRASTVPWPQNIGPLAGFNGPSATPLRRKVPPSSAPSPPVGPAIRDSRRVPPGDGSPTDKAPERCWRWKYADEQETRVVFSFLEIRRGLSAVSIREPSPGCGDGSTIQISLAHPVPPLNFIERLGGLFLKPYSESLF